MRKLALLVFVFANVLLAQAQEITEENYLKLDKQIWDEYEVEMTAISNLYQKFPEKRDSLRRVSKKVLDIASKRNIDAAIKYATVPSGTQRLFMVRLEIPKDTLSIILRSLPEEVRKSPYGISLQEHIDNKQIEVGDNYFDFKGTTPDEKDFSLSSLSGKQVLLLYGGVDCMGSDGREYLAELYKKTSRNDFEIVVYWQCTSANNLKILKERYPSDYLFVSDFLQDRSPVKIMYGAQASPTCFLIDKKGTVIFKSIGLDEKKIDELVLKSSTD